MYELTAPLNIWTTEGLTVAEAGEIVLQDETGIVIAVAQSEAENKQREIDRAIMERNTTEQEEQ